MKKSFLLFLFVNFVSISLSIGQCVLRGKITDENGEVLIGVAVQIKNSQIAGTVTDLDGNYSLKLPEIIPCVLIISYIGNKPIIDTIKCEKGGIIINNYMMVSNITEMKGFVIEAKAYKNNDAQLETIKKKSSNSIDFISAETIKKTGDANVGAAVARVTGVSTSSSGLITVRGIGDRYVKTTINGSRIPTLDPFTNNIKLDLFPSSLIDNIIITKTETPDLPGDWSGAYISIETKDYPDSLSVNMETSFGYNSQTSFKNIETSQNSKTDWLGYDNGLREFNHKSYLNFSETPDKYHELVALGLGSYLNSMGITESSWNSSTSTSISDSYFKLGLVQLGLLGKADINNPTAVDNAKTIYNSLDYKGHAFDIMNADAVKFGKSMPNTWTPITKNAPLSNSQSFSIGNQTTLFKKTLGFIIGLRYYNTIQSDENSEKNKIVEATKYDGNIPVVGTYDYTKYQRMSKVINGWSGLVNLAYKLNANNSFSLMFMPNMTGTDNVRDGRYYYIELDTPYDDVRQFQFYESRKQFIYQLKSNHYIPKLKLKIDFNASYTDGKSNAPDLRIIGFNPNSTQINNPAFGNDGRYFRYLTDNVLDSRIALEKPIGKNSELVRKIKVGGSFLYNYMQNKHYYYELIEGTGADQILAANPNANPFGADRFDITTVNDPATGLTTPLRTVQEYYQRYDLPSSSYFGYSTIASIYAMTDYAINQKLRFSGGVRVEKSKIYTDCSLFDSLHLASNDPRRTFWDEGQIGKVTVLPGNQNKISVLPSVNMIYKLKNDERNPINLRLNFSQTVARPSIRELSDNSFFDYELNAIVKGNSKLEIAQINNYDFRLESYFKSGDNISISLFYKGIQHHVELMNFGGIYMWMNNENYSWLKGVEVEGKKNIFKWLEFKANITFVMSRSILKGSFDDSLGHFYNYGANEIVRPMFGQSPYVFNSMLTYISKKLGLSATVSYNVQGARLVILGPSSSIPDVYELPRNLVDFKVSKKLGKHFNLSIKVMDILNTSITRSYKIDKQYVLVFDKYRYGTSYIFALSYKL